MKFKRALSLAIVLCLLIVQMPFAAQAAEVASGTCGDDLLWTLDSDGLLTVSGTGEMTSAPWLTDYAASITAVHMEEGITAICDDAFYSCANLTEVTIPEGVATIGNGAFYGCLALPELILPQSLRAIGKSAFSDCDALTEIVIPEGVTEILLDTFAGCYRLASVTLPSTVTLIDQCAFLSCPSLKTFVFPEGIGIVEFELFMNCYTLASVSIPASVCVIKGCAFQDCDALGDITIPDCVFSIGDYAFYKSGITALRVGPGGEVDRTLGSNTIPAIPDGIGRYSFSSCSYLTEVEISPEIHEIGEYAFAYSGNLTQCTFLGDAPVIDATAFTGVTATVYYPGGNATYSEDVMQDYGGTLTWVAYEVSDEAVASGTCGENLTWTLDEDGLLTVSGEGEMTEYPWKEEYAGSITSVVIEAGVTSIRGNAFSSCTNLTSVTVADTVASIGANAFNYCLSLESVNIPAGVETLGQGVFMDCPSLTAIVIPESVTLIGERAFGYAGLTRVEIPAGVTEIGESAFYGCEALKEIVFTGDVPAFGDDVFTDVSAIAYYPKDNATWTKEAMQNYGGNLTWVYQDEEGAIHGNNADDTAWTLSGDTLTLSGTGEMTSRTWLTFRNQVRHVVIQEGITGIGIIVFGSMFNLETVDIPSSVTYIGEEAFSMNDCLETVTIRGNGLKTVDPWAFYGCSALESLTLPDSVTAIGQEAFAECMGLQTLTFLGNALTFGENAFSGVSATVSYPAGDATWTEEVMQQYGGTLTWVAQGEAEEELLAFTGASVSLGNSLDMSFFLDSANVDTDCYAVLTRYYADGRDDHVVTVPYSEWNALDDGTLYVTYSGIAAKEMGDYMEVVIYNGSDEAISEVWVDSVKSYAMRMLDKEEVIANAQLRTLYVDMLNYGAAAQTQFGYDTANLVNANLTDTQKGYATAAYETESNLVSGRGRYATTLTLKSRITLDFIFTNDALGSDYTGLYAVAAYTDHYGKEVEVRIDTIRAYGGNCGYVSVPGLAVADYGQAVTCTVYDADGNAIAWATDSIEGYAHRMAGSLPRMVDAIMKFGVSAYDYFH